MPLLLLNHPFSKVLPPLWLSRSCRRKGNHSVTRVVVSRADAIAALITAPLMLTIGYLFANYYESVVHYANQVKIALLVLGLIVFGAVATYIFRKRWDTPEGTIDGGEVSDDAQVEAEIEQLEASAAGQGSAPAQPPKNV